MTRLAFTLAIALLVLPAAAFGKGPTSATLDGPGAGGGISFSGAEGTGRLGYLAQEAGFFAAMFGQEPSPMLSGRPKGDLGPKYTLTYVVPGGSSDEKILLEIYPYAPVGPVTYTAPGQDLFGSKAPGGWFQGAPELKATLVEAGLPSSASAGSSEGSSFPVGIAALLAAALLLATTMTVVVRRRMRPAQAT